ncbi:Oidioi.mRNA.OKI2018_I69.chr2.g5896.t1.cds [Oikopleura dioica]|uniref:DNA sliding clamp PCNA n=1 Tax=Oikopleura dioica TaxID=34765 RepID=A0ABN7T618_OIKDI|nr:Oidioi.mRNA.OKI2018_I69.chr2.g5896.t1.cds [Oikopleura dioica]
MFEGTYNCAETLKRIVDAVLVLVPHVYVEISLSGISVQTMDSAQICLIQVVLRSDSFVGFRIDNPMTLGVNFDYLSKILKCAKASEVVSLACPGIDGKLSITLKDEATTACTEFECPLIYIDSEQIAIENQEFTCSISMPAQEFHRICNDFQNIGEIMTIKISPSKVELRAKGMYGTVSKTLSTSAQSSGMPHSIDISTSETIEQSFSLRYLCMFIKATCLSSRVNLQLGDGTPLIVTYEVQNVGSIKYFLASQVRVVFYLLNIVSCEVDIPTYGYRRMCEQFADISQRVRIQVDSDCARFSVGEGRCYVSLVPTTSNCKIVVKCDTPVDSYYRVEHLTLCLNAAGLSDRVTLKDSSAYKYIYWGIVVKFFLFLHLIAELFQLSTGPVMSILYRIKHIGYVFYSVMLFNCRRVCSGLEMGDSLMFECTFLTPKYIKLATEVIADFMRDGIWEVTQNGLSLQCKDDSRVTLLQIVFRRGAFSSFHTTKDGLLLGVKVKGMHEFLKCVPPDHSIQFSCDEHDYDNLMMKGQNKEGRSVKCLMHLVDLEIENLLVPPVVYSSTVRMPSLEFKRIITKLVLTSDTAEISCVPGSVTMFAVKKDKKMGDKTSRVNIVEVSDPLRPQNNISIDVSCPFKDTYTLRDASQTANLYSCCECKVIICGVCIDVMSDETRRDRVKCPQCNYFLAKGSFIHLPWVNAALQDVLALDDHCSLQEATISKLQASIANLEEEKNAERAAKSHQKAPKFKDENQEDALREDKVTPQKRKWLAISGVQSIKTIYKSTPFIPKKTNLKGDKHDSS